MKFQGVQNMLGRTGGKVPNQFEIYAAEGVYFQSYDTIIAFRPYGGGKVQLDRDKWDFSVTTGKYRNQFLGCDKAATLKKIKSGEYEFADLNG